MLASLMIKSTEIEKYIMVLFSEQTMLLRDLTAVSNGNTFVRLFTSVCACRAGK
jgi:hypothetical protein